MPKRPKKTRPVKPKPGQPAYQVSWWEYHPDGPVTSLENLMMTVSTADGVYHLSAPFLPVPAGHFRCGYVWGEPGTQEAMNDAILLHVAGKFLAGEGPEPGAAELVQEKGCSVISAANRRGLLAWDQAATSDPLLLADMMDLGRCSARVIRALRSSLPAEDKALACEGVWSWINGRFLQPEWRGWTHFLTGSGYGEIVIREGNGCA